MFYLLLLAFAQPVRYSTDIAPILAFHCNGCHGADDPAAGLNTTTHAGLMESGTIVAGDPTTSRFLEFIDGRRTRRMPLNGTPLSESQLATFRQWIAEGAKLDSEPAATQVLRSRFRPPPQRRFDVVVRVPARAYLRLEVRAPGGRTLYRDSRAMPEGGETCWSLAAAPDWPSTVSVDVAVLHSGRKEGELSLPGTDRCMP